MIKEILDESVVTNEASNEEVALRLLKVMGIEPESIEVSGRSFTIELQDKKYADATFKTLDKFAKISKTGNKPKVKRDNDTRITLTVTV